MVMLQMTQTDPVANAVRTIAADCDHAHDDDGIGFNASDTWLGHALADLPDTQWTDTDRRAAWEMLAKYTHQLAGHGIDYTDLPEPPAAKGARQAARNAENARRRAAKEAAKAAAKAAKAAQRAARDAERAKVHVDHTGSRFTIAFGYHQGLVDAVRIIPGRAYNGATNTAPTSSAPAVVAFLLTCLLTRRHYTVTPAALDHLAGAGLPEPEPPATITLTGRTVVVEFPYDPDLVQSIRDIPGRDWDGHRKVNTFPIASLGTVIAWADTHDLPVPDSLRAVAADRARTAETLTYLSTAATTDLAIPDLPVTLRDYQRVGVHYATVARRCWIADEPGLGKTVQAFAALETAGTYPAVVVAPAALKTNWAREAAKVVPDRTVTVLDGRTPGPVAPADITVVNFDIVDVWGPLLPDPAAVIVDEAHLVKNPKARRSGAIAELVARAADDALVLFLTGTPLPSRTRELVNQLAILDRLDDLGGERHFLFRYCDPIQDDQFWTFDGASEPEELNARLRSLCYVRRLKDDVLHDLPPKTRQRLLVDASPEDLAIYRRAEDDLVGHLTAQRVAAEAADAGFDDADDYLDSQDALGALAGTGTDYARSLSREIQRTVSAAPGLTRTSTLRILAAAAKLPVAVDYITDFLAATGRKVVVFAHHRRIVDGLADALDADRIHGGISHADRQDAIDRFQADPDTRILVCGLQAAGVGLTLTAAQDVVFVEQAWTPGDNDQAEDRAHRFGQVGSVTATYLTLPDSIDEDMWDCVEEKRVMTRAVADGIVDDVSAAATEVVGRIVARRAA